MCVVFRSDPRLIPVTSVDCQAQQRKQIAIPCTFRNATAAAAAVSNATLQQATSRKDSQPTKQARCRVQKISRAPGHSIGYILLQMHGASLNSVSPARVVAGLAQQFRTQVERDRPSLQAPYFARPLR